MIDDRDCDDRTVAYVMSLPKAQRTEAYVRLCGRLPPPGALGAFDTATLAKYALPAAAIGLGAYLLFFRKRRSR